MPKNKLPQQNMVIVILGPTSSGKSEAAIKLAGKFNGEIISADSRQIYKGMDIGTGKVTGRLRPVILSTAKDPEKIQHVLKINGIPRKLGMTKVFISHSVIHHLIDIVSPKTAYNVSNFKKDAEKIIADILSRGKLPIICGGTGFWIKAIVDNVIFPEVKPNWKLRKKLDKKSITELIQELKKLDPQRAQTIDAKNKVRLIRAIEICKSIGKVPPHPPTPSPSGRGWPERSGEGEKNYEFLQIGINFPKKKLHKQIKKRLEKRFKQGMIKEVEKLKKSGLGWKKIQSFGLGYYWIPLYLQNKLPKKNIAEKVYPVQYREAGSRQNEIFNRVYITEKDYAKRQMTWFKKDKRIKWLKNYTEINKQVKKFLSK